MYGCYEVVYSHEYAKKLLALENVPLITYVDHVGDGNTNLSVPDDPKIVSIRVDSTFFKQEKEYLNRFKLPNKVIIV